MKLEFVGMVIFKLLICLSLLLSCLLSVCGQDQPKFLVWSESPTCGATNLLPTAGVVECSKTVSNGSRTFVFKHAKLTLAIKYWWYASHVRVLAQVENQSDTRVSIEIKSWRVTGYESFDAFKQNAKPLFVSEPESPEERIGLQDGVAGSLPSDGPSSGQSRATRSSSVIPGGGAIVPKTPIGIPSGSSRLSVMSWKEIPPRSRLEGQARFDVQPKARYLRLSLSLDEINYIYTFERLKR